MKSSYFGDRTAYFKGDECDASKDELRLFVENDNVEIDPEGISSFFTFRYPVGDRTMFRNIKKVPCGYEMIADGFKRYWYPRFEEKQIGFEEALDDVESLLLKSIDKLSQDKEVAVPLSGGVDSSLVVAMLRKQFPERIIRTYSAGFYGDDEFEYSRLVAKEFNTVHKEKVLHSEDYIGDNSLLKSLIKFKCEPLHPNELALAEVEKMAKEDGCEIALCGEGGDDIFGGYGQNLRMYMNYGGDEPFFKYFLDRYRYFSIEDREKILKDYYNVDDYKLLMSTMDETEIPDKIENKVLYFTQKVHTIGLITRGANAMRYNGLELGFPYIDEDLVNYVNALPFEYKVHWKSDDDRAKAENKSYKDVTEKYDVPKYILKKLAEKYLPHKVIYRPKYGFPVPFDKWFKDLNEWPMNKEVFKSDNIASFSGWKKFMLINLNTFVDIFNS